ncbi:hypothetical protein V7S43_005007 [Phytophthora oleae]|uniref:Uncharacterized protein n=1 Tax=Phytophthora oleae TaxID=2107226 RepID=A0ABD3FUE8_9STRA
MKNNQLNGRLLVQFPMLQLLWLKFVIIATYFLPHVVIWGLGGRIASDAYDDLVCQGCRYAVSVLRDLQFVMQPVVQPVVSVLLLLLATDFQQNHFHDGDNKGEP